MRTARRCLRPFSTSRSSSPQPHGCLMSKPSGIAHVDNAGRVRCSTALACKILIGAWVLLGLCPASSIADDRLALVIGNGAYKNAPQLENPAHDAEDVAAALKRAGFTTLVGINVDKAAMEDLQIRFSRAARAADVALFYYSGHALQFN